MLLSKTSFIYLRKNKAKINVTMKRTYFLFIFAPFLFLISCQPNSTDNNIDDRDNNNDTVTSIEKDYTKKVKKIFYTVPSPIEMTNLLQKAGSEYNPNLLNSTENIDKYVTVSQLAINLGVYGADLSYNRMFDQIQLSVNYLAALRKISDKLGIPEDEGTFAVNRIEDNMNNRDSVMQIISETYANADAYFKGNDMPNIAAMILMGGWTEGIYIAINVAETAQNKRLVVERIAEQKLSLDNLVELMKSYSTDETIQHFYPMFIDLQKIFDKVNVSYQSGEVKTDTTDKTTTISGTSSVDINDDNISSIKNKIIEIRKEMIL